LTVEFADLEAEIGKVFAAVQRGGRQ
jgi:hypothetical protein